MNTLAKLIALPLGAAFLAGCASTDFQPLESQGPVVAQGRWGTRKVVDGVDIWTTGAPPRKYRVLGVVNDTRGGGVIPMAGYYSGIAAKVKQYGGNAAIEVGSQSQYVGTASFANATTTTSGGYSGTGYNYGNFTNVSGRVNTTSNTFASGTALCITALAGVVRFEPGWAENNPYFMPPSRARVEMIRKVPRRTAAGSHARTRVRS